MRSLCPFAFALALVAAPALAQSPSPISVVEDAQAARYEAPTGHATASGEPYNPERLTLAHPTLPFGTLVALTNDENGATVTARVNDRVPDSASANLRVRVSARTADQLGLPARGGAVTLRLSEDEIAFLQVRALQDRERTAPAGPPSTDAEERGFTVQLASFSDEGRATAKADELRGAWVLPVRVGETQVYRVCYGVFAAAAEAAASAASLRSRGIDGFVKSLDAAPMRTISLGGE